MTVKSAKKVVGEKVVEPKSVVVIPKSREEASGFVRQVGDAQRELKRIAADSQGRIAAIEEKAGKEAQPHKEKLQGLVDGLFLFFAANRNELTEGGKRKSVDLATGVIGEHTNPHKAVLTEKMEIVLTNLHALKLEQFIRSTEEINREAMLESEESRTLAATVKGVKVVQVVEFRVKPTDTLEEIVADEAQLKRRIA
ncbi:hypothetical protein COY65_02885 [Candidatus Jorgensenbacteria bacterium CG_4_10_14_0_8_um_filter_39_13]|uniref:Host-nuclease inhibitor protein Gam n=1 Tax=Candidatus Jorgensenbacteria bacterium CG_4_10_14_0_8_um_filter_39_13 TaxID=1974589 RepID=A0A2M7RG87_9BACT|nr:MAG: hypothetical protein AUJ11_00325 [Parcubacteria group bacterium CG1_02_44_65]PIY95582.1 MAG: hypothetical protein COY65_02885 [Candidatus Jorgensenbacteria bacterium CG_4_10_14_0_8_um_filter_39_13]PJA94977.1 MAG: hypothetical protein CO130_01690 [Candidatus Jorgensenbacteria bacterium CG_4_9_14_3_um_filter_38_10]